MAWSLMCLVTIVVVVINLNWINISNGEMHDWSSINIVNNYSVEGFLYMAKDFEVMVETTSSIGIELLASPSGWSSSGQWRGLYEDQDQISSEYQNIKGYMYNASNPSLSSSVLINNDGNVNEYMTKPKGVFDNVNRVMMVVWTRQISISNQTIQGRFYGESVDFTKPLTDVLEINTNKEFIVCMNPSISASGGIILVVYSCQESGMNVYKLVGQYYDGSTLSPINDNFVMGSFVGRNPVVSPLRDSSNNFIIVIEGYAEPANVLYFLICNKDFGVVVDAHELSTTSEPISPYILGVRGGGFVVTYINSSTNSPVFLEKYNTTYHLVSRMRYLINRAAVYPRLYTILRTDFDGYALIYEETSETTSFSPTIQLLESNAENEEDDEIGQPFVITTRDVDTFPSLCVLTGSDNNQELVISYVKDGQSTVMNLYKLNGTTTQTPTMAPTRGPTVAETQAPTIFNVLSGTLEGTVKISLDIACTADDECIETKLQEAHYATRQYLLENEIDLYENTKTYTNEDPTEINIDVNSDDLGYSIRDLCSTDAYKSLLEESTDGIVTVIGTSYDNGEEDKSTTKELSAGALTGIILAVIVVVVLIMGLVYYYFIRPRRMLKEVERMNTPIKGIESAPYAKRIESDPYVVR